MKDMLPDPALLWPYWAGFALENGEVKLVKHNKDRETVEAAVQKYEKKLVTNLMIPLQRQVGTAVANEVKEEQIAVSTFIMESKNPMKAIVTMARASSGIVSRVIELRVISKDDPSLTMEVVYNVATMPYYACVGIKPNGKILILASGLDYHDVLEAGFEANPGNLKTCTGNIFDPHSFAIPQTMNPKDFFGKELHDLGTNVKKIRLTAMEQFTKQVNKLAEPNDKKEGA